MGILAPHPPETRVIDRLWTWIAMDEQGALYPETYWGSLRVLPNREAIRRLSAVETGKPADQSRQAHVMIPLGAEPIAFTRTAINVQTGRHEAMLVLGWRNARGDQVLLWLDSTGDAIVSDRDLEAFNRPGG